MKTPLQDAGAVLLPPDVISNTNRLYPRCIATGGNCVVCIVVWSPLVQTGNHSAGRLGGCSAKEKPCREPEAPLLASCSTSRGGNRPAPDLGARLWGRLWGEGRQPSGRLA